MPPTRKTYQELFPHYRPNLKPSQSNGSSIVNTPRRQRYDIDSGQVYKETEVLAGKRQRSDWIGEFKTPTLVKHKRPNPNGARSLFDMAKATVGRQLRGLTSQDLAEVPWQIAEKVWTEVEEIHSESFHAWRTFAAAYQDDFKKAKYRYLIDIKQPGLPLADYFSGINSPQINWLTCLRLAPRQVSVSDVVRVSSIKNLAVLDLSDGHVTEASFPALDERVFKTWAELAVTGDAFRHLRVLMLGWQEVISKWIFKYLDSFPSLCHVLVTDSLRLHQKNRPFWEEEAAEYGWVARSAKKSARSLKPILDDKNFYLGAVSGCYYNSQELFEQLTQAKKPKIATKLPVLECWLGGPKRWNHVVEEFPGTRTVWFDNVKIKPGGASGEDASEVERSRELFKRDREVATPSNEVRPPPSKKKFAKQKPSRHSATNLLAEFGHA